MRPPARARRTCRRRRRPARRSGAAGRRAPQRARSIRPRSCAANAASLARAESGGTRPAGSIELRRPECIRSTIARRPARTLSSPAAGAGQGSGIPERSALPRCVRSIRWTRSDRWGVGGSWGLSIRWCRRQVAGTSTPMSHQAGARPENPGQHLSVADRRNQRSATGTRRSPGDCSRRCVDASLGGYWLA